jgi:glycosyltransferase involved in cell wall biosynthesis
MSALPKVSCVMPACYGEMALLAVQCFLDQTYEGELELIVLDNNDEGETIEHLLPEDERIKYHRTVRKPLGALRNEGNRLATGEVICNWDCDDWSSPDRVAAQVERLKESGKAVTGWHNVNYFNTVDGGTYKYFYEADRNRNHPPYAFGASQVYQRAWWEKYPYPETGVEDFQFQQEALHRRELDSSDAGDLYVVRSHQLSLCPPQFGHKQFPAVERTSLPQEFFDAIGVGS